MSSQKPAPIAFTTLTLALILCTGCEGINETQGSSNGLSSEKRVEVETVQEQSKKETKPVTKISQMRNKKPLAIEEHNIAGVEVALMKVKRSGGDTLTVYWNYTNNSSEDKELTPTYGGGWYGPYKLAGDTYIIDNVNQKKHLVVKANDRPITSKLTLGYRNPIPSGARVNVWAKFPAPPADVETISVYIPGIPPIEDVQITD